MELAAPAAATPEVLITSIRVNRTPIIFGWSARNAVVVLSDIQVHLIRPNIQIF